MTICSLTALLRHCVTSSIQHGVRCYPGCSAPRLTAVSRHVTALRMRRYSTVINSPHPDLGSDVIDAPMMSLAHYVMNEFSKYHSHTSMVDGITGREVSYSELQTLIVKVSSSLVRLGLVSKGTVVTLYSPNCFEYAVIYLAIVAAEGIVSPINPVYTADELVHGINLVQSTVLVTSPSLLHTARQAVQQCKQLKELIVFGEDYHACRPFSSLITDDMSYFNENIDLPADDMVVLPFSSGTTGLPKAVMLTHHSLRANIEQCRSRHGMNFAFGEDCFIAILPFYHIYGQTMVLLGGLASGIKIVTLPKFEPKSYLEAVEKQKATYLMVVPPIMLFLADHPLVANTDFSCVHSIVSGAAPLGAATTNRVRQHCRNSQISVRQAYGLTEASPLTHCQSATDSKDDSVGAAIQNTQFKIVNPETNKCLGLHQDGEIYIRGPQLMKGYYNNEKATNETIDSDGWLHTGDVGHYDEDGHLTISDRLKELIKVKGFQVAPAELEAVLLRHESVQDAAVIGQYVNERVGELPTAFIVLKPEHNATQQQLQQFVAEHVAVYKQLTGGILFCQEIPKSASGKILRRELRVKLKDYLLQKL